MNSGDRRRSPEGLRSLASGQCIANSNSAFGPASNALGGGCYRLDRVASVGRVGCANQDIIGCAAARAVRNPSH